MRVNKLVIDSWAWIEYLGGTDTGRVVDTLLKDEGNQAYTTAVSLAEIVSKFGRNGLNPDEAVVAVDSLCVVVPSEEKTAIEAGRIHAAMRKKQPDFGLADAVVIATAEKLGAKIVTGDPHFKGVKNVMRLGGDDRKK